MKNKTSPTEAQPIDLVARAHQEMIDAGFLPDFEPAVYHDLETIKTDRDKMQSSDKVADLRSLLWSSIDNPESKDLDQIEYVERLANGKSLVMIGIADVDSLVAKGSATDHHAFVNTTSVYTGVVTYPMLPDDLSFDLTSLLPNQDRRAIVIELIIDKTGAISESKIHSAIVRNRAKLDYKTVGQWLENGGDPPDQIAAVPALVEQLLLQNDIQKLIHDRRKLQGSLYLHTLEATTVAKNGQVLDLELVEDNPARELIENFMIAGNIAVSQFLENQKIPSIRRVVKTPERWDRIVTVAKSYGVNLPASPDAKALADFLLARKEVDEEHFPDLSLTIVKLLGRGEYVLEIPGQPDIGHFALAVHDYTHATAPNRRYPDLIMQRLIKAANAGQTTPYSQDNLKKIAEHCTEREDAAQKLERKMRKVAAAVLLSKHIGQIYDGIVTGVTPGGTYARLIKPPAEGKIIHGEQGLDVGDKVKLRLVSTDPVEAFIDFERA